MLLFILFINDLVYTVRFAKCLIYADDNVSCLDDMRLNFSAISIMFLLGALKINSLNVNK